MANNDRLNTQADSTSMTKAKKTILIIVVVALVLLAAIWIWKEVQIRNVQSRAKQDQEALKVQATKVIARSHEEHLKLLAKPFVWALRTEMMQGNMNQVNLYLNDMVKEKNIQRIVIADTKGLIVASTNKKDEGKPFSTISKAEYMAGNNTTINNNNDSIIVMSSPIMGFNSRLGTLMIAYKIPETNLK